MGARRCRDDRFAGGPKNRGGGSKQEPQDKPGVDVLPKPQGNQRSGCQNGRILHYAGSTDANNQAGCNRREDNTGTRLRNDAEANDGLAEALGVEDQR